MLVEHNAGENNLVHHEPQCLPVKQSLVSQRSLNGNLVSFTPHLKDGAGE